jgi:hypothetical protein
LGKEYVKEFYFFGFFLGQIISIMLQRMQAFFILSQAVAIGLTTSRLSPLWDITPIIMANLLQAIGC